MRFSPLNGKTWPTISAVTFAILMGGWLYVVKRERIDFGKPEDSYVTPEIVHTGDEVWVNYNAINWIVPAPAVIKQWYACVQRDSKGVARIRRVDLPTHTVPSPPAGKAVRLPPKSRRIESDNGAPLLVPASCEAGPFTYGGRIEMSDWSGTYSYDLPTGPKMTVQLVAR